MRQAGWMTEFARRVERRRRLRLLTTRDFTNEREFRTRAHMSRQQLRRAERRSEVFSLTLAHTKYFPRLLLDGGRQPHRLRRLVRALGPTPPWLALNWLESKWTNLQGRSPLQAIRRGDLYCDALCDAEDQGALHAMHDFAEVPAAPAEAGSVDDDQSGYEVHSPHPKGMFTK